MTGNPRELDTRAFLAALNRSGELSGMRVVYYDGGRLTVLREGPPVCAPGLRTVVLHRRTRPERTSGEEGLYRELLGGALSCSAAALSTTVVVAGIGATPITGGLSTTVAVLGWAAAGASFIQCGNSLVRVANEMWGEAGANDALDRQEWYSATSIALDTLSVFGAAAAGATTIKMALALRRSTGQSMVSVLKGLSRQQRKRIAEDLVRVENPGISNKMLKAMVRAGAYPRRFRQLDVSRAVRSQLKDALSAALGFTGSATGGVVRRGGEYMVSIAEGFRPY